jgi:hypothetical protein
LEDVMAVNERRQTTEPVKVRTLHDVAVEVRQNWPKVYFGAVPYLDALITLDVPVTREAVDKADFYADSARSVVLYFLANAQTWRGEVARRVKAELKAVAGYK